jgi:hypothetical protein
MKKSSNLPFEILIAVFLAAMPAAHADIFAGSDTFIVTNAATAVIPATNAPLSGGEPVAWYPAGILAHFRDSPTGAVLIVSHVRTGILNPLVSTNAISISNTLFTATNTADAAVWNPAGVYNVTPATDHLRIETSSTNAEVILFKHVRR